MGAAQVNESKIFEYQIQTHSPPPRPEPRRTTSPNSELRRAMNAS